MADINPSEEHKRPDAVGFYHILDAATEKDFDGLTELAAIICDTPIAIISFIDGDQQWFKSLHGINIDQISQYHSFCFHAIQNSGSLVQIENTENDFRFQNDSLNKESRRIRFYGGTPLLDEAGHAVGSLCVMDHNPRLLNETQEKALRTLAQEVMGKLSLKKSNEDLLQINKELTETNNKLTETEERLKKSNAELTESRERLQTILNTVGEGIGITDEKGNIVYANKRNREIFKFDEEESMLALKNVSLEWNNRRLDGSPLPAEEHPVTIALKTGTPVINHEFIVSDKQGNSIYLRMNSTPIKDGGEGKITGAIGSFADITESYLLQQHLKEKEESLQTAISSANLGTWHIDTRTREFFPSPRLKEMFGFYPDEDMPYDAALTQIADSHRQEVIEAIEASITKGHPYELEYPIIGYHDKELRWVCATGHLYNDPGNPAASHFSGTLADITERKRDEQRRSDFIGMVSHELRNPLTAIKAYAYILKRAAHKNNDEMLADSMAKVDNQVKRMEALINGFLDVARLGEGKIRLNKTRFDMAHLVRIAEEESLATITSHQVVFAPVEFTPVEADQDKIEQVLINFINNAVKYSASGTVINVACVTKEETAYVYVTDHGMGISSKDQPFIFDRFYRVESEAMKNKKGFGIGLYICKEIIERHNGQIGVESVEGKGSTFWFTIPIFQE